jgi:hypothetical protein
LDFGDDVIGQQARSIIERGYGPDARFVLTDEACERMARLLLSTPPSPVEDDRTVGGGERPASTPAGRRSTTSSRLSKLENDVAEIRDRLVALGPPYAGQRAPFDEGRGSSSSGRIASPVSRTRKSKLGEASEDSPVVDNE